MVVETAIMVGALVAVGVYLLLQPSFVRVLFGFILFSNAANLFILAMSGDPSHRRAPVLVEGANKMMDPLPQALILTAIVIGFGVSMYLIVLLYRLFLDQKTTHVGEMFDEDRDARRTEEAP